jgi:hypothetical protein
MILAMDSLVAPRHGHIILFEFIAQTLGAKEQQAQVVRVPVLSGYIGSLTLGPKAS